MAKHTPGPWLGDSLPCNDKRVYREGRTWAIVAKKGETIADMPGWDEPFVGEELANVNLIAAAPDYHDAAEAIRVQVENYARMWGIRFGDVKGKRASIVLDADLIIALLAAHAKAEGRESL